MKELSDFEKKYAILGKETIQAELKELRRLIAEECEDDILKELYELDESEKGFYQYSSRKEVLSNIMKIIRGGDDL